MGVSDAFARFMGLFFWAISMNFVVSKGGDYVTLVSFGSSICILTTIIRDSISKGLITFFSYFLGQNNWEHVWKSLKSGMTLLIVIFFLLAFPLLIYNSYLIKAIIDTKIAGISTINFLRLACYWLWIFFLLEGIAFSLISLIIAMKETVYLLKANTLIIFLTTYFPFYLSFKVGNLDPDKIWMLTWICCVVAIPVYFSKIIKTYRSS